MDEGLVCFHGDAEAVEKDGFKGGASPAETFLPSGNLPLRIASGDPEGELINTRESPLASRAFGFFVFGLSLSKLG